MLIRLPAFSTNAIANAYNAAGKYMSWYTNDTGHSSADATTKNGSAHGAYYHPTSATTLGLNTYEQFGVTADGASNNFGSWEIVSPIHTSSHYQPFETPFLYELVGGDRNMEQTNLVVTTDGKTWDEVTRDTSYIGNMSLIAHKEAAQNDTNVLVFETMRGDFRGVLAAGNKDFAIGYDRWWCLRDGMYSIHVFTMSAVSGGGDQAGVIAVNGTALSKSHTGTSSHTNAQHSVPLFLKRGDYVQSFGKWYGSAYCGFMIHRMPELKEKYGKISHKRN
jgi:hypothetical protein